MNTEDGRVRLPERTVWDHTGAYEAALLKLIRARRRGRGARLTADEVDVLCFSEGDGVYFNDLHAATSPTPQPKHPAKDHQEQKV